MKKKTEARRAAERIYAKEHGVSVEYAHKVLCHDKALWVEYKGRVDRVARVEAILGR